MVYVTNPRIIAEVRTSLLGTCRYRSAARCLECGQGCLPVGVMRNADALEGFERHLPPAVVVALHAGEPSRQPLCGKGVAGGHYFRLAGLGAT